MSIDSHDDPEGPLPPRDGLFLVQWARHVVTLKLGCPGRFDPGSGVKEPRFQNPGRAFVTLELDGELRGCIGFLDPRGSLLDVVENAALAAAFDDPRFAPLSPGELEEVVFEVSVLSEPREDRGPRSSLPSRIEIGRHGLIVESEGRRGVLLPQVALEWGWNPPRFLSQTCLKAGLPKDLWKEPECRVLVFSSQVFKEERDQPAGPVV